MRTVVETLLPVTFLTRYGVYMQTCAHIEMVSWHIVLATKGYDFRSDAQIEDYLKMKKVTWRLLDGLKQSVTQCPPKIGVRVGMVAKRIEDGIDNRNLAAHGALHFDDAAGAMRVRHDWQARDTKQWMYVAEPIREGMIKYAISDADEILKELIETRNELAAAKNVPF